MFDSEIAGCSVSEDAKQDWSDWNSAGARDVISNSALIKFDGHGAAFSTSKRATLNSATPRYGFFQADFVSRSSIEG